MKEILENVNELASINEQILAEGERAKTETPNKTGTFTTLIHNINLYNISKSEKVEQELRAVIPTLVRVGVFDLFSPEEWMNSTNEGRKFVGKAAMEYFENQP